MIQVVESATRHDVMHDVMVAADAVSLRGRIDTGAFPRWLHVADRVHRSQASREVVALDAAALLLVAVAVGLEPVVAAVAVLVTALLGVLTGLYARRDTVETLGVLWYPARAFLPAAASGLVLTGLAPDVASPGAGVRYAVAGVGVLIAIRVVTWVVVSTARRAGAGGRPTMIVGGSEAIRTVVERIRMYPEAGLFPVALVSGASATDFTSSWKRDVRRFTEAAGIAHVVLVPDRTADPLAGAVVEACEGMQVQFSMVPPLASVYVSPSSNAQLGGVPMVALGPLTAPPGGRPGKRLFDVVGAAVMLVALAPVFAVTALMIRVFDGSPVLYRQRRVGFGGQAFGMLKFRSMVRDADRLVIDLRDRNVTDGLLFKVENDPRVTRVGRLIRRSSIDELPQLWNVLRGEMSLVGPRPLPVEPEEFGPIENRRHVVRPGITGYWQTAGGPGLSYTEMIELDLSYIRNWSLWLDIRLLLRTLPALVHRRGPA